MSDILKKILTDCLTAEQGSNELDVLIAIALEPHEQPVRANDAGTKIIVTWSNLETGNTWEETHWADDFSGDLTVALSLLENKFPELNYVLETFTHLGSGKRFYGVHLFSGEIEEVNVSAKTPALAVIGAICAHVMTPEDFSSVSEKVGFTLIPA